jgi:hypothetical protein
VYGVRVPETPCTLPDFEELTMTTANTTTKTKTTTEMPDLAKKIREQLVSSVQQGQQLSIDAAQNWVKAVSVLPIPELPAIPGVPTIPGVEAVTTFTFDVAADLLNAQRDFALQLTSLLVPSKSA